MKDIGPVGVLRIPLHVLWEFPDITAKIQRESDALEKEFPEWFSHYSHDVQQNMVVQLNWAIANPGYDFQSILKNVKTSNADILTYFVFLQKVFAAHLNLSPTA